MSTPTSQEYSYTRALSYCDNGSRWQRPLTNNDFRRTAIPKRTTASEWRRYSLLLLQHNHAVWKRVSCSIDGKKDIKSLSRYSRNTAFTSTILYLSAAPLIYWLA